MANELSLTGLLRQPWTWPCLSLRQWDRLLRLARSANLIGRLAEIAIEQQLLERLPPQVARHLLATSRLTAHQQQAIEWECSHLEKALRPLGVPIVLLKGAAYAMRGQRAARGRLFGDVDLLVPGEALNAVEAALMLHGWRIGSIDPYDERYYRRWMHELPPMVNHRRGTIVDVHHNILPLSSGRVPDAATLIDASVGIPGRSLRTLSPCDMLIHSATHLFHEGELNNGLRDLYDLDALLVEFAAAEPQFWPRLLERAVELKLVWPVFLALRYAGMILGTVVPEAVLAAAAEAAAIGRLKQTCFDAMYLRALAPDNRLVNSPASSLARAGLYLRAHGMRMPVWQLAPHLGRKAWLRMFKQA